MGPEKRCEILVIDDTPANLDVLTGILQERGHLVRQAPDGEMGLASARTRVPDLVLLDIHMPGMNGWEVCRHLRADPKTAHLPVLFLSAMTEPTEKVESFRAGGNDFISKPFHVEEVLARVDAHWERAWALGELRGLNRDLEARVARQVAEIAGAQLGTIHALVTLAEKRDDDTGRHLERVRYSARLLARALQEEGCPGVDAPFVDTIFVSSPLHDIGKVAIPDSILLKRDRLTPEEFQVMKSHADIGARTLLEVHRRHPGNAFLAQGIDLAWGHHERWDGSGYPRGLSGEAIPLPARIMAIVDVYDALRSRRPYKEPMEHGAAVDLIRQARGTHLWPRGVDVFLSRSDAFAAVFEAVERGRNPDGA